MKERAAEAIDVDPAPGCSKFSWMFRELAQWSSRTHRKCRISGYFELSEAGW